VITNNQIQEVVVARLRDNTRPEIIALHAALATDEEIRENQFQGAEFAYPAIRVALTYLNPTENIPCRDDVFRSYFSIISYSEDASSLEADTIAGLVAEALDEAVIDEPTFRTGNISLGSVNAAIRIGPRLWRAETFFRASIYQK
jgi:hypothetical protein